jgi:hypothetical protein
MHSRIEKSAFRKGRYIGYAYGVWYIERDGRQWVARHRDNPMGTPTIWGNTLEVIGKALGKVPAPRENQS